MKIMGMINWMKNARNKELWL